MDRRIANPNAAIFAPAASGARPNGFPSASRLVVTLSANPAMGTASTRTEDLKSPKDAFP